MLQISFPRPQAGVISVMRQEMNDAFHRGDVQEYVLKHYV